MKWYTDLQILTHIDPEAWKDKQHSFLFIYAKPYYSSGFLDYLESKGLFFFKMIVHCNLNRKQTNFYYTFYDDGCICDEVMYWILVEFKACNFFNKKLVNMPICI